MAKPGASTWTGARRARIYVAHRETSRGRLAQDSAMSGIVPALVIIPLVWLAILLTVRSALAVIDPLSARARRLDIGRLEPLPTGDVPAELMPLVTSINIMISRLAHSLQAEKKFIAEAAHEMRSPLTALRIQADNLGRTLADADSRAHFDELQQGIARNARLVNQLLNLARADAGPVPTVSGEAPPPATRVLDIVTDVIAARLPKAAARGIDLGAERMEDAHVACDARIAPLGHRQPGR
jgi:two-component system OmpR family sensor kinase